MNNLKKGLTINEIIENVEQELAHGSMCSSDLLKFYELLIKRKELELKEQGY